MPTVTLTFTNAGAAGAWANPGNALANDTAYASLAGGATNGWLILSGLSGLGAVPAGARIDSVAVRTRPPTGASLPVEAGSGGPQTLDLALTTDGWSPAFGPTRTAWSPVADCSASFAGPTLAQLGGLTFGAMVRRGTAGDEDATTSRNFGQVVLDVAYTVVSGGAMPVTSPRIQGNQKYVYGLETTPGTAVSPDTSLLNAVLDLRPAPEYQDLDTFGDFANAGTVLVYEAAAGELRGRADYNELVLWLAMTYGKPASETIVTGAYRHETSLDTRKRANFRTISLQKGDDNVAERFAYVALRSFSLRGTKKSLDIGGSAIAKAQTDAYTNAGVAALQNGRASQGTIATSGVPTGGTFRLRFKGVQTATIAYNAIASAVQSALEALSTIGVGNITVGGTAGAWTYSFAGTLLGVEQERIEVGALALTGGTAPTVTTAITQQGGWKENASAPMVGSHVSIYMATTPEGLDDPLNKVADLYEWNFELAEKLSPQDQVDRAQAGYTRLVDQPFNPMLSLGVQADQNAQALAVASRNGAGKRYVRIEFVSPQEIVTGSAVYYAASFDYYGDLKDMGEVTAFDQTVGRRFGIQIAYSPTWGRAARAIVKNAVASA